jgi:malonyl-CoA O-methyltransferase
MARKAIGAEALGAPGAADLALARRSHGRERSAQRGRQEGNHAVNILPRMAAAPSASATRRPVDERALQRAVERLQRAAGTPWLHGEVARRMAERLAIVKLQPASVLDWWAHLGAGGEALARAYPRSKLIAVEREAHTVPVSPWWSVRRWARAGGEVVAEADVALGQAQLVWANMVLHSVADPGLTLRRWQQALAVDGFLMFSTLGPGSLPELRAAYAGAGWGPALAPLVDMHDIGDMLVEAGFADPVMDQELVTLTWDGAAAALAELRGLGANAAPGRAPGLRTPRWRARLLETLDAGARARSDGRVALTFEVVYGHAFKPVPRARVAPESRVALEDLRSMARATRRV